ncbi:hypothetical protein [Oceanicoccus sp. KOV_DT_Chl]|uniref:hypothetical protein n=1 Tax=Oceanicoccus sp. KOV_DT_Chl TaxID=1904639 RepID=UPI000C7DF7BA|nr:hypothetical protein [Oceanicoccus sp. KOV_DT_Chl]
MNKLWVFLLFSVVSKLSYAECQNMKLAITTPSIVSDSAISLENMIIYQTLEKISEVDEQLLFGCTLSNDKYKRTLEAVKDITSSHGNTQLSLNRSVASL